MLLIVDCAQSSKAGLSLVTNNTLSFAPLRMALIATEPALSFGAAEHYAHWEQAVSDFAGRRLGLPAESLYPLAVGRSVLAACRAAYDRWVSLADTDLTVYLDAALTALASGFSDQVLTAEPKARRRRRAS